MTTKDFRALGAQAKKEVARYEKSPFRIFNELNKAARKNEYCDNIPIAKVAHALRTKQGGRYAFTADALRKDSRGRFVTAVRLPKVWAYDTTGDAVAYTYRGCDIIGDYYLRPIAGTLRAYLAAFCQIVRAELQAEAEAQRQADALAKAQRRVLEQEAKVLAQMLSKGCAEYMRQQYEDRLREVNNILAA